MLSPYRVIDLTDERGQFASLLLAQLGADVVVVEPPGGSRARLLAPFATESGTGHPDAIGPGESLVWHAWNRGKRSVVLDYDRSSADRASLLSLIDTADFLFDTHPPGALAVSGLGFDALSTRNRGLIQVSISAFGRDGPKATWPASDLTVWAAAGPMALTGDSDRAPLRVPGGQAFLHAAAEAVGAALAALLERRVSGSGQHIDVAAQQASAVAAQAQTLCHPVGDVVTQRSGGGSVRGRIRNRYLYPAADGHVTVTFGFGGQVAGFTRRLLDWMYEEGFADESVRDLDVEGFAGRLQTDDAAIDEYERLQQLVARFTSTMTKQCLFDEALRRKLLVGPVATMHDVLASPQLESRSYFDEVAGVRFPGPFAKVAPVPLRRLGRAPRPGEHQAEVVGEQRSRATSRSSPPVVDGLLTGLKVLDFTWSMAGPLVTRSMADYGATVVRVESSTRPDNARTLRPLRDGRGPSAAYGSFSAGKLGLGLNLSHPDAREIALDMVRWADVVVESFSPRAMRSWRLHYEELRRVRPDIVMLSSCLMGQDGPFSAYAAFGNTAASVAGFTNITGWPDRDPSGPYSAYTDYVSPRLGLAAVLAALDARERTGAGCYIDLSQIEAAVHFLTPALLEADLNGTIGRAAGNRDPNFAPHGVYRCKGTDRWVAIACESDVQWQALAPLIGPTALSGLDRAARHARCDELDEAIGRWTAVNDEVAIVAACIAAGVPAHAVQNSEECWEDPQLNHRQHFRVVPTLPDGTLVIEGPRAAFSRSAITIERAGPGIGEDSWSILTEILGYDPDRVADLLVRGVVE